MDRLTLSNDQLALDIDAARGADIVTLVHRGTGVDVLFSTPWRARAEDVRAGRSAPSTTDPVAGWLEQYRGGWQTLCPNAGPPRLLAGAPVGFHGEASLVRWAVAAAAGTSATLRTELFSVPVAIERTLTLHEATVTWIDTLRNLSADELEFDYASHPAFGGTFLQGDCEITTAARRLVIDPGGASTIAAPGSVHEWPWVTAADGQRIDMRKVPPTGEPRMAFGWLTDFDAPWAAITNTGLGLTVRLDWDATYLPHAWFWQELNGSAGFPWFRRVRVVAIEPSSTQTSGPDRRSVLSLGPHAAVDIAISVTLTTTPPPATPLSRSGSVVSGAQQK